MVMKTVIILLIANVDMIDLYYTAIPYRASTGPEQGFPCEKYYTGKTLFSLQGWVCSVRWFYRVFLRMYCIVIIYKTGFH